VLSAYLGVIDTTPFRRFCREVRFAPGDVLRTRGQHYADMFLMVAGAVAVDLGARGARPIVVSRPGAPIGEISFLWGCGATATVVAKTEVEALAIDDAALARLEREQPVMTAHLLRDLGRIADDRVAENLVHVPSPLQADAGAIEVLMCRNAEMLAEAQRLRYEVYCGELGRQSPFADHERRTIADALDEFGHTFVARENGETIGTLRLNLASEGPLGILEELYGMRGSPHHPRRTGICTKFIVRKARRGSPASLKLIAAVVKYGLRNSVNQGFIDCIPPLLPYYKALGFRPTAPPFLHRENGTSYPMVLDLARHGRLLAAPFGPGQYLRLFVRAKAIKLIDRLRGPRHPAAAATGAR
jgi:CRP-like cAMP-binding protein